MNKYLRIGIIQTSIYSHSAWVGSESKNWKETIRMSIVEENRAKNEIRHFLSSMRGLKPAPDIVLLPELAVPIGFEASLMKTSESMEAIIIAGLDYRIVRREQKPTVSNEAVVIVPRKLGGEQISMRTELRRVGKTDPAPAEKKRLEEVDVKFKSQPTVWLFESEMLGNFAVAICYDFIDLDRIVLYRNKIQTLFILAYNRDINSFDHVAEAVARMVFCNVVVCNCGYYGGSFAVSPYRKPYKRIIYRHSGKNLENAQIIELPLEALFEHQKGSGISEEFKSLPPRYSDLS